MSIHDMVLEDFPRGGRILKFGCDVEAVLSVEYYDEHNELVVMDTKAYLHSHDRLILARDVWPKVQKMRGPKVFIEYTTA